MATNPEQMEGFISLGFAFGIVAICFIMWLAFRKPRELKVRETTSGKVEHWICLYHRSYGKKFVSHCVECVAGNLALFESSQNSVAAPIDVRCATCGEQITNTEEYQVYFGTGGVRLTCHTKQCPKFAGGNSVAAQKITVEQFAKEYRAEAYKKLNISDDGRIALITLFGPIMLEFAEAFHHRNSVAAISPHSSVIYTDLKVRCRSCGNDCCWRYDEEADVLEVLAHECVKGAAISQSAGNWSSMMAKELPCGHTNAQHMYHESGDSVLLPCELKHKGVAPQPAGQPAKCPRCESTEKHVFRPLPQGCTFLNHDEWHNADSAAPESVNGLSCSACGAAMVAFGECNAVEVLHEKNKQPLIIQEPRRTDCKCDGWRPKEFRCLSCGTTTGLTEAAPEPASGEERHASN